MYCLWEQFGLVDDKRELSLNGMLTFFQRIPAYRAEVEKAISECKGIGNYLGIRCAFSFSVYFLDRSRVLETCDWCQLIDKLIAQFVSQPQLSKLFLALHSSLLRLRLPSKFLALELFEFCLISTTHVPSCHAGESTV